METANCLGSRRPRGMDLMMDCFIGSCTSNGGSTAAMCNRGLSETTRFGNVSGLLSLRNGFVRSC